jgi:hypothetical protein
LASLLNCLSNATTGSNVVLFDEKGIEQTNTVVETAAAGDRVFLRVSEAGDGFSGVE